MLSLTLFYEAGPLELNLLAGWRLSLFYAVPTRFIPVVQSSLGNVNNFL